MRNGPNPYVLEMPFRDPDNQQHYQQEYARKRKGTHRSVKVTMTLAEFGKLERLAMQEKTSVSRLLFTLASDKVGNGPFISVELKERLDEVIRLLLSCGNNINQIAHACNLQAGFLDQPKSPQEGVEILTQIHKGLVRLEILIAEKLS